MVLRDAEAEREASSEEAVAAAGNIAAAVPAAMGVVNNEAAVDQRLERVHRDGRHQMRRSASYRNHLREHLFQRKGPRPRLEAKPNF